MCWEIGVSSDFSETGPLDTLDVQGVGQGLITSVLRHDNSMGAVLGQGYLTLCDRAPAACRETVSVWMAQIEKGSAAAAL